MPRLDGHLLNCPLVTTLWVAINRSEIQEIESVSESPICGVESVESGVNRDKNPMARFVQILDIASLRISLQWFWFDFVSAEAAFESVATEV